MKREITLNDTLAVAIGAGILGTGGGGNTYIGRTWLEKELRERSSVCQIIDADEVADDAHGANRADIGVIGHVIGVDDPADAAPLA